jgi:Mn2+/Fe2+ NRAMP family transporter
MTKCALLYFVVGVTITTASYAFFSMPQQMFQAGRGMMFPAQDTTKAQPQTLVCDCNCNK